MTDFAALRTQWLRARAQLVDPETSLPTLAAVLDDARRLLAAQRSVGVLYFAVDGESEEASCGWQAYDAYVRAFAETLKVLRRDGHLAKDDIIATIGVRSESFIVFAGGGLASAPLDRGSVARLASRAVSTIASLLEDRGHAAGDPRPGFQHGFTMLGRDPMLRPERSIQRAIDDAIQMALVHRALEEDELADRLDAIISGDRIQTLAQPVVQLGSGVKVGREVYSRGPSGSEFESPLRLFALAERCGRLVELERLCLERALRLVGRRMPRGQKLFLNTSVRSLHEHLAQTRFAEQVDDSGVPRDDIVVDIPERLTHGSHAATLEAISALRRTGFRVALDDMGGGHSNLQSLMEVAPEYLKFDIALVRGIDRNRIKRGLLETLLEFSVKIGATVIAEGIETPAEFATVQAMGVEWGQGHYLGEPELVVP
jgi:EAL domain-containing protein (putative c-di-GMP-specific phosphodiesterase class I)